ncbi:hypothetical protein ACIU1J_18630 [Azospirillum doebereinerae]|uniref:hypothetical protein n=1 Tax=Azospirillum doebereinerae TaxID=92933 RepID=UPI00384F4163
MADWARARSSSRSRVRRRCSWVRRRNAPSWRRREDRRRSSSTRRDSAGSGAASSAARKSPSVGKRLHPLRKPAQTARNAAIQRSAGHSAITTTSASSRSASGSSRAKRSASFSTPTSTFSTPMRGVSPSMAASTRSASAAISSGVRSCVSKRRSATSSRASETIAEGSEGAAVAGSQSGPDRPGSGRFGSPSRAGRLGGRSLETAVMTDLPAG